jgi:hypothetical protein
MLLLTKEMRIDMLSAKSPMYAGNIVLYLLHFEEVEYEANYTYRPTYSRLNTQKLADKHSSVPSSNFDLFQLNT